MSHNACGCLICDCAEADGLRIEIARLRSENDYMNSKCHDWVDECREKDTEIERLQETLANVRSLAHNLTVALSNHEQGATGND